MTGSALERSETPRRDPSQPKRRGKGGAEEGYISRFLSFFRRKDPRTPVKGIFPRLKNIAVNNFRGLLGFFVPLFLLSWQGEKGSHHLTVQCMWIMMFWFFLMQPVNVPVTALIPVFILPMAGVMSSIEACKCYMNEGIVLFILTGMLGLLLNNSGVDRRLMLWILCSGDNCQFAGKRLVFKCTTAAYFLSMFCSRLIVTSNMIQYVAPALINLQAATSRGTDPNFDEMRYVICNAIQTASAIGSVAVPHASLAILAFRAMFYESPPKGKEYPDIFNYFQYCVYAFPVSFLMHILNFAYHMILINVCVKKAMSAGSMTQMRNALLKHKNDLPKKTSAHEKLSVFFTLFYLLMCFLRWSKFLGASSWGNFRAEKTSPEIPGVKDSTVAALFLIALHMLPKGLSFFQIWTANKKSQLSAVKPESAILWWRFVDKNMNYGYIFMLGCGVALTVSVRDSGLGAYLSANFGKKITDHSWNAAIFLVCLIAIILANAMSSVAACAVWLPFILNMSLAPDAPTDWQNKVYLGALGVGVGTSLGFMWPFLFTPAYFCHYTGKVPKKKMAKYGIGSAIICLIILWLSLCLYAPYLWDPNSIGINWTDAPTIGEATPAPEETPEAGGGEAEPEGG